MKGSSTVWMDMGSVQIDRFRPQSDCLLGLFLKGGSLLLEGNDVRSDHAGNYVIFERSGVKWDAGRSYCAPRHGYIINYAKRKEPKNQGVRGKRKVRFRRHIGRDVSI